MARKYNWKHSEDPDEIMKEVNQTMSIGKFDVLTYFAEEKQDLHMLYKLLTSGYFKPEEVANRRRQSFASWTNPQAIELANKYANLAWQELTDPEEIYNMPVKMISEEETLNQKLDYFSKHNKAMYNQLLNIVKVENPTAYLTELLKDKESNYETVIDFLMTHPYVVVKVQNDPQFRPICEEVQNRKIKLANTKDWRDLASGEMVMYHLTEENKWEVLEYFANHNEDIFKSLIKRNTYIGANKTSRPRYTAFEMAERYKNVDTSKLPKCLQDYIAEAMAVAETYPEKQLQNRQARKQGVAEKRLSWKNEDGQFLCLFNVGKASPSSAEDYEKILNRFLSENLSVSAFCSKYKISNETGFKQMLRTFGKYSEKHGSIIQQKAQYQKAKFMDTTKKLIKEICDKDKPVSLLFAQTSLPVAAQLTLNTDSFAGYYTPLMKKVIDYYYERLNSYDNSNDPVEISKRLTRDEIRFLVGKDKFAEMMRGKHGEIDSEFASSLRALESTNPEILQEKFYGRTGDRIRGAIKQYNSKFLKSKYLQWDTSLKTEDGNEVAVTPELLDMAFSYASAHKLYTSSTTVDLIIQAIINGKIANFDEMVDEKKAMVSNAYALLSEVTNLDEFFKGVDNIYARK